LSGQCRESIGYDQRCQQKENKGQIRINDIFQFPEPGAESQGGGYTYSG